MPIWIDKEDNLEGNLFMLVRRIQNSKSVVISYMYELKMNTIYKNLVQLNLSEILINVLTMCDKVLLERCQHRKDKGKKDYLKTTTKKQHNCLLLILVCYSHLIEDLTTTPIGEISKTVGLIMTYLNSHSKKKSVKINNMDFIKMKNYGSAK